jgi:hypothetical protein
MPEAPPRTAKNINPVKISLGGYQSDVEAMASQYNMKLATFCAYCAKYFVDYYNEKSLPPLKRSQQRNLNI